MNDSTNDNVKDPATGTINNTMSLENPSRIIYRLDAESNHEDEVERPDYILLIMRRWKAVVALTALGFVLSFVFAKMLPKSYETAAMVKLGSYAPPAEGPVGRHLRHETEKKDYLVSQVAMMKSYKIAEDVFAQHPELVEALRKNRAKNSKSSFKQWVKGIVGWKSAEAVVSQEQAAMGDSVVGSSDKASQALLRSYLAAINYQMVHGTSLVKISATASDPYLAESIANAHANEFITLIQNNLARLATVNLEFLRERLVTAETAYTDAERAALKYAKDNDLAGSNVKAIQNALAQRYNHLFGRLHELILNRAKSEARFREYRSSSSNAVVFDPEVGTEFSRLSELDAKLKVAKEAGIDNLYFFEQLKSERSTLLSALKEFGKRRMKSSEMEFKAAKEAESLLRNELEKTQDEERRLYSKMVDFSAFRDSADAARENFKQVRKRFEDAQLNAQNEQNIVLLIDKARTPQSPTSPNVNLIIGLGVICSFLGSIFLTIAVDSVDQTIGSVLDLTKTLNTPVLGMIPRFSDSSLYGYGYEYEGYGVDVSRVSKFTGSFKSVTGVFKTSTDRPSPKKKVRQKGQPMVETAPVLSPEATEAVDEVDSLIKELSEDTNSGTKLHGRLEEVTENFVRPDSEGLSDSQVVDCNTLPGHGFEIYEHVVAHGKQWTRVSEAFREVFVAIESYSKQAMNSILIASGDKGDGKSTIAANLAVVYAQSGRRTVLIDADIRLPSVQESIGIPEGAIGLTDFLAQDVGAMEIVYPTENESLFVIPAGTLAGPSPQLGTGKKLKELLELLSDDFDTIIIDGPPVLHVADGLTISRMVDGVALVVRNGKTLKETAKWVTNRLQYLEANVLGVIYNDVPKMHNFSRYSY